MTRQERWQKRYERSCVRMASFIAADARYLVQDEARLLLEAAYRGPWRAIAALVKKQIKRTWRDWAFRNCAWFRNRIFEQMPAPIPEIAQRTAEEDVAIREMINEL